MLRGSDSEAGLTFELTSSLAGRGRVLMLRRYLFLAPELGVNLLREALTFVGLLLMATLSRLCLTFLSLVSSDSLVLDLN